MYYVNDLHVSCLYTELMDFVTSVWKWFNFTYLEIVTWLTCLLTVLIIRTSLHTPYRWCFLTWDINGTTVASRISDINRIIDVSFTLYVLDSCTWEKKHFPSDDANVESQRLVHSSVLRDSGRKRRWFSIQISVCLKIVCDIQRPKQLIRVSQKLGFWTCTSLLHMIFWSWLTLLPPTFSRCFAENDILSFSGSPFSRKWLIVPWWYSEEVQISVVSDVVWVCVVGVAGRGWWRSSERRGSTRRHGSGFRVYGSVLELLHSRKLFFVESRSRTSNGHALRIHPQLPPLGRVVPTGFRNQVCLGFRVLWFQYCSR